jgi:hypothetical protein
MRIKRLILPGQFVEAYLYFDFAWLFSKDGTVRAFDIARYCEERLNGEGVAAKALFSNNQLLATTARGYGAEVERLLASERPIEVLAQDVDAFSYIFETKGACRSVLDVRFYNGRAFVGSTSGIMQFVALGRDELQGQRIGRSGGVSLDDQRVSDRPARQIQARYGAVAAACGTSGGVLGTGAGSDDRRQRIEFEEFAQRSYGVELNGNAVSSLAGTMAVELYAVDQRLAASRAVDARDDEPDRYEVSGIRGRGFASQDEHLNRLISEVPGASQTFLFKTRLWVLSPDGFHRFVLTEQDAVIEPQLAGTMPKPAARVLSTSHTEAGVILEADDEVFIKQPRGWEVLIPEPVYSVRGYSSSRRYKRLVSAVTRERVELAALV